MVPDNYVAMFYYQNRGYEKPDIVADRGGSNVGGGVGGSSPPTLRNSMEPPKPSL